MVSINFGKKNITSSPRENDPFSYWLSKIQRRSMDSVGIDVHFTGSQGKMSSLLLTAFSAQIL